MSVGVNVTEYSVVLLSDTEGFVVPAVHAKVPSTLAVPPESVESDSICPFMIEEAVGAVVMEGVPLFTASFNVVVVEL